MYKHQEICIFMVRLNFRTAELAALECSGKIPTAGIRQNPIMTIAMV